MDSVLTKAGFQHHPFAAYSVLSLVIWINIKDEETAGMSDNQIKALVCQKLEKAKEQFIYNIEKDKENVWKGESAILINPVDMTDYD